jgi:hypothetical protein
MQAINFVGRGDRSDNFVFETGNLSRPGTPQIITTGFAVTGGSLRFAFGPPTDCGTFVNACQSSGYDHWSELL